MKVAIVGDVHLTLRKYKEFEENRFKLLIDELIATKPHIVIFAGDLLDQARPTLEELELMYYGIDKLKSSNIKVQIISGNHEAITSSVSTYDLIMKKSKVFVNNAELIYLGHKPNVQLGIKMVGWTKVKELPHIKTNDILVTHLRANHGLLKEEYNIKLLSESYSQVFMGDLHFRYSPYSNVHYTSSPYSTKFTDGSLSDYGYIMLNSVTKEWEYIDLNLPCKVKRKCTVKTLYDTLVGLEKHLVKIDISGTLEELKTLPTIDNVIYNKQVTDISSIVVNTNTSTINSPLDLLDDYVLASDLINKYPNKEVDIKNRLNELKGN